VFEHQASRPSSLLLVHSWHGFILHNRASFNFSTAKSIPPPAGIAPASAVRAGTAQNGLGRTAVVAPPAVNVASSVGADDSFTTAPVGGAGVNGPFAEGAFSFNVDQGDQGEQGVQDDGVGEDQGAFGVDGFASECAPGDFDAAHAGGEGGFTFGGPGAPRRDGE
jgi:hypothetical protein